jgi:hypothetical protein
MRKHLLISLNTSIICFVASLRFINGPIHHTFLPPANSSFLFYPIIWTNAAATNSIAISSASTTLVPSSLNKNPYVPSSEKQSGSSAKGSNKKHGDYIKMWRGSRETGRAWERVREEMWNNTRREPPRWNMSLRSANSQRVVDYSSLLLHPNANELW